MLNLPNRLTLLRVVLIPLCLGLIVANQFGWAAAVFIAASLTDFLDGYLARKKGLVTNFGKFADPVADKILVLTVMIALLSQGMYPWWAVCVVAVRELAVDGLRLVAVEQGIVIAAAPLGKYKTVFQMISVVSALLFFPGWLTMTLVLIMSLLTIISGVDYFRKGRAVFTTN